VLVPHDQSAVDGAVLSGRTLVDVAPRSPARVAMRDLVASRFAPAATGHRRRKR
jgi:Flp pilus assembly CpaE family ATPase